MAREFAPGIPAQRTIQRLPTFRRPRRWQLTLHVHEAQRAGRHFDLRLGDPATRQAHSWALRYWPEPGQGRLAVQQPTHTFAYMNFTGQIEDGYGAGMVSIARREAIEILEIDDRHVRFNAYPGQGVEEYLLLRTQGHKWLLRNVTPQRAKRGVPDYKPKHRQVKTLDSGRASEIWQAKLSGAHVLIDFTSGHARVYSYRQGQRSDLIQHTQKIPGFENLVTPPELRGSVFRGELVAEKGGEAIPEPRVGGILNAGVWRSRDKQRREGRLKVYVHDVVRWRGQDVENDLYGQKIPMLDEARRLAPWLKKPRTARRTYDKNRLLDRVGRGQERQTSEGIVAWDTGKVRPAKFKFGDERDVWVVRVYTDKHPDLAAGIEFSETRGGPVVGRVASGFKRAQRLDMARRPESYVGLKAKIESARVRGDYAPQKPVFKGWHLDQQLPEKVAAAPVMAGVVAAYEPKCPEGTSRPTPGRGLSKRLVKIMAKMRPGDIVNTDPRLREGFGGRVYKPLSEWIQGTGYGHSAIYEGRGQVIEARSGFGVRRRPLSDLAQCNKFVVIRPRATDQQRRRALAYVRAQLGKQFSDTRLTASGAKPTFMSGEHQRQRQALTSLFCSNMIANAYDQVPFNPGREINDTRPVDILKSKFVKRIGKLG